jgi:hypothetical protein
MKTAVVSVAFYSLDFSKVLIGSFRRYYPVEPMLFIVDNNKEAKLGQLETKELKARSDIVYIRNLTEEKSHGRGLDLAFDCFRREGFDMAIAIDIDSLILKKGLVEICEWLYRKADFKHGGRRGKRSPGYSHPKYGHGYVHPQCGFYCLHTFHKLDCTFRNTKGYDAGEEVTKKFHEADFPAKWFDTKQYVHHFGCGSLLREDGKWGHAKFRRLGTPEQREELKKKYLEKRKNFFDREDVKCYL